MTTRRHVHTRTIRADVFVRDDALWDVEAELVGTKARDFMLADGMRPAGAAIHRMRLTVTEFYPRWYRPAAQAPETSDTTAEQLP